MFLEEHTKTHLAVTVQRILGESVCNDLRRAVEYQLHQAQHLHLQHHLQHYPYHQLLLNLRGVPPSRASITQWRKHRTLPTRLRQQQRNLSLLWSPPCKKNQSLLMYGCTILFHILFLLRYNLGVYVVSVISLYFTYVLQTSGVQLFYLPQLAHELSISFFFFNK